MRIAECCDTYCKVPNAEIHLPKLRKLGVSEHLRQVFFIAELST
jgi:hypothetical protein